MTISILRTADAWWVQTATGAARVDTDATTTAELLADRSAIDAATHNIGPVTGPFGDIVKPSHVQLLDYELEIGLVFGRELPVGTEVTAANLADFVVGLVVTNDISARDVQLTKQQFFESKSYPSFTPVGPALVLLDAEELNRFGELRLRLSVNGQVRQDMIVEGDILYPPV